MGREKVTKGGGYQSLMGRQELLKPRTLSMQQTDFQSKESVRLGTNFLIAWVYTH